MNQKLALFLTIDVGPAGATLGEGHTDSGEWTRTADGLEILSDIFRSTEDIFGLKIAPTWFFRADRLIAAQFGDRFSIFKKFYDFVHRMILQGHEVGWMPQVYSSLQHIMIDYEDLSITHGVLVKEGIYPRSVRMGDCFHDNTTMKNLNDLKIQFDSSAVPGRIKEDSGWRMNWMGTPEEAYYPSLKDYRKPGIPHLNILEVPISVLPIKAPYDSAPLLRYLNPCMYRGFLWQNLPRLINSNSYLICILHPDEVVPIRGGIGHPLVAYSIDELRFNLHQLIKLSGIYGRTVTFHTIEEFNSVMG